VRYKYIICTAADNDFFAHLEKLVVSAGKYAPEALLQIALVNVPKEKAAFLRLLNPNVEIIHDYIYFLSDEMMRGYCTNRKPSMIQALMAKTDVPIIWIDADSVFTRPDTELYDILKRSDLCTIFDQSHPRLKMTPAELEELPHGPLKTPYYGIFSAGVVGTNNSPAGKKIYDHINALMETNPYAWFSDQEALYLAYLKFKDSITFNALPPAIADEGNYEALVCFAKGSRKDGPFRDIGVSLMWNFFKMEENVAIRHDMVKLGRTSITNIRRGYRVRQFIKSRVSAMLNTILPNSGLNEDSVSLALHALDWNFSKHVLRQRYIRRRIRDFDMYLDTQVPGISRTLAIHRKREEDMTALICRVLKPGMTVLDCGSNIGYYPLLAASQVGPTGKVICIEPDPRNFDLLKRNLTESPLSQVFTHFHMAISDQQGEVPLSITEYSNLNKVVKEAQPGAKIYKVPSDSIDNLLDKHDWQLDLLRMDIEGHEVEVLKGARRSLPKLKSGFTVFLEVHPTEYSPEHDFEAELRHLLANGFYCRYLVSAGVPMPPLYAKLGYQPSEVIKSDGVVRGVYTGIDNVDHIVSLVCDLPKASRYIMLTKK
jgi:FkbM family methyltransferase